jgi:Tol biopolymer transport system component
MDQPVDRLRAALADRYRIERELGMGGMATVYLAHDLKHDRLVAVKVLKPELAAVLGAERFVVEIKTTASMSHPHILPLFDSGSADGFLFYVMPFIEGETLRDRLNRETQLGIDESVRIAREVLDALEYAHTRGVIHRDIKPENILMQGGRPMIADFGIALAVSAAAGGRMTETGLSLGTPHYMSPEQATAEKEITGRADIYSLAIVLYEMLTGEPPHMGNSAQQIIMKIITEPAAPVTKFRKSVPPNVAAAVAKALEKLPADRFESAKAFADALGNSAFTVAGTAFGAAPTGAAQGRARLGQWAVGAGVGALVTAAALVLLRPEPPAPDVVRFEVTLPPNAPLDIQTNEDAPFALSPDGKRVVFATRDSVGRLGPLHIRELGHLTSTPLPGTAGAQSPFFSPDGLWVGFTTDNDQLKKVPVSGGPAITLAENVQGNVAGGSWGDDGYIIYLSAGFVTSRVRGTGGASEALSFPDSVARGVLWPFVLPGSRKFLAAACTANCAESNLVVFDVATRQITVLVEGATRGWYLPGGQLVYATREGAIYAVPFDPERGEIRGAASPVLDAVRGGDLFGYRLAVSASGAMVYLQGASQVGRQIVAVDRAGRETVLVPEFANFGAPRWSPTRDRIAVVRTEGGPSQIWIYDVRSQTLSQLTTEGNNVRPSWSPDGTRVAFYSARSSGADLYWMPADGSGPAERVADGDDTLGASTTFWTRDGAWIVIDGNQQDGVQEDIFVVGTGSDRKRKTVVATPADEQGGVVSPDGRWIAYVSNETGSSQVYVRPFMRPGGRWLVSNNSAVNPLWASNTELTYRELDSRMMVSATLAMGQDVRVTERRPLFSEAPYLRSGVSLAEHDLSWDGQHFLMLKRPAVVGDRAAPIVVLNWAEEVRQRMQEQGGRAP